jgi:preprotein translocase subunit SecG
MIVLFTVIHIIVCAFLIIVVLLQSGQSGDIAAAFGGMGSQTAFGTRTAATVLGRATTWAAIVFMCTSIILSVFAARRSNRSGSVLEGTRSAPTKSVPAQAPAPVPQPAAPTR